MGTQGAIGVKKEKANRECLKYPQSSHDNLPVGRYVALNSKNGGTKDQQRKSCAGNSGPLKGLTKDRETSIGTGISENSPTMNMQNRGSINWYSNRSIRYQNDRPT